jgi:hypothetical protein
MLEFIVSGVKSIFCPIVPRRVRDRFELSLEDYERQLSEGSWRTLL